MELRGNNAAIIMDDTDIDMALNAVLFAAVGTAGQSYVALDFLFVVRYGLEGIIYATLIVQVLFMLVKDLTFYFMVVRKA